MVVASLPTSSSPKRISVLGVESVIVGHDMTALIAQEIVQSSNNGSVAAYIVITDSNIERLGHLSDLVCHLERTLKAAATTTTTSRILTFVLPPGEAIKTRQVKDQVENWMLANKCTRDSCLIALGGGVVGDMMGFVAATYMRGIPVIQVPTTLLAMVDSSIGGKTAVDTPHGKNLIGSFHQPRRILMDTKYLKTLPQREFVNGMAEVIKTAAIWDDAEFTFLENNADKILEFNGKSKNDHAVAEMVVRIILGSASVKAHVVTVDEKETGLRGLLNFGHTIGHAIEAILSPQLLHGECVSIGMIKEAEVARHLGHLNDVGVGRLSRCLSSFGLPVSLVDNRVQMISNGKTCPVDTLLDIMKVDKKNQGDRKRIVLLSSIGKTLEPKASFVSDHVIRKILSPAIRVLPPKSFPHRAGETICLNVPGSKSISNRALLFASLGSGVCRLRSLLHSDDVQVMLDALQKLVGIEYQWENNGETLCVTGGGGRLTVPKSEIYLGNAGTASRFLTTVCALISRETGSAESADSTTSATILTGNARMKQRPIGPLVDALSENGSKIKYLEKQGSLPLEITPNSSGLKGGMIRLSASISSQYVSSILISAPYAAEPVTLVLTGENVVSQPYIDMTIQMMKSFGVSVVRDTLQPNTYHIPKAVYNNPAEYIVEADASSATYPLAFAAVTGAKVKVENIGKRSLQGDAEFAIKVLGAMGCAVDQTETTTTVQGPLDCPLLPIPSIDMETMTDAFLTASVLAAFASKPANGEKTSKIYGIENQRVKECDRIAAMVQQLSRFGVDARENPDGLEIDGVSSRSDLKLPHRGVKCFDDHRIAMSFSVLACGLHGSSEGAIIREKKCVEKTWPGWWDTLQNILGVDLEGVDITEEEEEKEVHHANSPSVADNKTIILVGMRGVGKTHAGKALAKSLSRSFIDMDTYLEEDLGKKIPDIVGQEGGWEFFRQQEARLLQKAISESPTNAVIACGGGIVETEESRQILKEFGGKSAIGNESLKKLNLFNPSTLRGYVLHLKRSNIADVVNFLNTDKTRPMFATDLISVWERRKPWYAECSTHEFIVIKEETEGWDIVEKDLVKFAQHLLGKRFESPGLMHGISTAFGHPSFFLSLTFPDVKVIDVNLADKIFDGINAVELRVDLLSNPLDLDYVGEQLAQLRRLLLGYSSLPIIFTVRTKEQGGRFPSENFGKMAELLSCAVKWGCEFIDVEILDQFGQVLSPSVLHPVLHAISAKGHSTKIIASFHDVQGRMSWDKVFNKSSGGLGATSNACPPSTSTTITTTTTSGRLGDDMKDIYSRLATYGDVVKIIGVASSLQDNFELEQAVTSIKTSTSSHEAAKPLIALNMKSAGQLSRALNTFLTPVTHPNLPVVAAPGQISVKEINQLRHLIQMPLLPGGCEMSLRRCYYLFGKPISHSFSPTLHNTGFDALGLPFTYGLHESDNAAAVVEFIKTQVKLGLFGGSSVTIPLKEELLKEEFGGGVKLFGRISDSVSKIGAVNTIGVVRGEAGKDALWADNTDWLGIRACFYKHDHSSSSSTHEKIGIVIGAGGTARAAAYALGRMGCSRIRIWNRTVDKAKSLAQVFGVEVVEKLSDLLLVQQQTGFCTFYVVSTIPASAQESLSAQIEEMLLAASKSSDGILVEMAYKPRVTPLIKAVKSSTLLSSPWTVVEGIEALIEQGFEQFSRWTGMMPPKPRMRSAVLDQGQQR